MSHRYKSKAPSTAMYRHFAAITVVATLMIALFADDKPALAVSSSQTTQAPAQQAKPKPAPSPTQQPGGVWGSDSDDAGLRAITASSSIASFASAGMPDLSARFSADYLNRLSQEERDGLLQAMAENGADGTQLARSQAGTLERESRYRSGSAGRE